MDRYSMAFGGRTPGAKSTEFQIHWDCRMPHGSRFNQPEWTEWREVVKIFVWSLLADPPQQRRIPKFKTIYNRYKSMLVLVTWMVDHGFHTFTELDQDAQQRFISDMAKRKGRDGNQIRPSTLKTYNDMLCTCCTYRDLRTHN